MGTYIDIDIATAGIDALPTWSLFETLTVHIRDSRGLLGFEAAHPIHITGRIDGDQVVITTGTQCVSIEADQWDLWNRFREIHAGHLWDILLTIGGSDGHAPDMMLVLSSSDSDIWLLYVYRRGSGDWNVCVRHLPRLTKGDIDIAWAIMRRDRQRWHLDNVYRQYCGWLGEDHPLFTQAAGDTGRALVIKVDTDCLWFLRFPLPLFFRQKLAGIRAYAEAEWLVSGKSFLRRHYEQDAFDADIADAIQFIRQCAIVVNVYAAHSRNTLCRVGTLLLFKVMALLQNIPTEEGTVSLHWLLNPTIGELEALLADKRYRYIYTDMESDTGQWQLSDEVAVGLTETIEGRFESTPVYFPLFGRNYDLSHIRLMRAFHCNAAFDAGDSLIREPADQDSIVRQLLDLGVWQVEGGLTRESYLDFLAVCLRLLCDGEIGFYLGFKCRVSGVDYGNLIESVNHYLSQCNWPILG